jgi:predicted negative regulator of RcsB-dependent stress response
MATKTDMAPNREIDQVLSQTDMGEWIAKNKTIVIVFLVVIIGGIFAWGGYSNLASKRAQEHAATIYAFQEGVYTGLIDKKVQPKEFVEKYLALEAKVSGFEGLAPVLIKAAGHLKDQGATLEVIQILEPGIKSFKTPILVNVISIHLAVAYEDNKEYGKAIEVLENLNSSSLKLMEDKIYLDLGRLYLSSGNKEKAKVNLQYLVDNGSDAEFMKIARLYLEDIEQGK